MTTPNATTPATGEHQRQRRAHAHERQALPVAQHARGLRLHRRAAPAQVRAQLQTLVRARRHVIVAPARLREGPDERAARVELRRAAKIRPGRSLTQSKCLMQIPSGAFSNIIKPTSTCGNMGPLYATSHQVCAASQRGVTLRGLCADVAEGPLPRAQSPAL
jgi:hypothetical protein